MRVLPSRTFSYSRNSLAIFEDHLARASDVMIIRLTARAPLVRFP